MGTPLPPIPIEEGDDCAVCFGTDKTHPNPTPLNIQLELHDWSEGQGFNEAWREELENPQEIVQQFGLPCLWAALSANFVWYLQYAPGGTLIVVNKNPPIGLGTFSGNDAGICLQTVDNDIVVFVNNIIFGGYASVYFGSGP